MSIHDCEVLIDNGNVEVGWFYVDSSVALKLFRLIGFRVSVFRGKSLCIRYHTDTLDSYADKMRGVLRDN